MPKTTKVETTKKNIIEVSVPQKDGSVSVEQREVYDLTDESCPEELHKDVLESYSLSPNRGPVKTYKKTHPEMKKAINQVSRGVRRLNNECLSPAQRLLDWTRQGSIKGTVFDLLKVAGTGALMYFVLGVGKTRDG